MFGRKMIKTGFQSEIDQFFHNFDKNRQTFPPARIKEVEKHKIIFDKRDNPKQEDKQELWKGF